MTAGTAGAPPCVCTGPESCGIVGIWPESDPAPCHVCGKACYLATKCGARRCSHVHFAGPERSRGVYVGPDPLGAGPAPAAEGEDKPVRLLDALYRDHSPARKLGGAMRAPRWRPGDQPSCVNVAHVVGGYSWARKHQGKVVRLDRNAAFLSAASSVRVAHGALEHTGPANAWDPSRAGYFLVQAHPWQHQYLPNPLGNPRSDQVWVPGPTVQLLAALADDGRWADVEILDSWTGYGVDLRNWTTHARDLRAQLIENHGKESEQVAAFKVAYSQAITMMIGVDNAGTGRTWPKCQIHRPDWSHSIIAMASATLWRAADTVAAITGEGPVAVANVDELHIPAHALTTVTDATQKRFLRLDNTGIKLGHFKVKG